MTTYIVSDAVTNRVSDLEAYFTSIIGQDETFKSPYGE